MRIVAEGLNYTYSAKSKFAVHALKDVSLTVEEGEFFAIVGHTGSGKSTFVQHLNGLIRVGKHCGKLTVGEYDLTAKKCDLKALRSKIGMVFQYPEYQLFAETVAEDVAFGLKNFEKLTPEQTAAAVKEAMETVGLPYEEFKDKSPFEMSGGQKRRAAIAGVIVTKPEVLVLTTRRGAGPAGEARFFCAACTNCTARSSRPSSSSRTIWTTSPNTPRRSPCSTAGRSSASARRASCFPRSRTSFCGWGWISRRRVG